MSGSLGQQFLYLAEWKCVFNSFIAVSSCHSDRGKGRQILKDLECFLQYTRQGKPYRDSLSLSRSQVGFNEKLSAEMSPAAVPSALSICREM